MPGQWLSEVFSHPDVFGALVIAGKTSVVYLFLVVGLRLLGKSELGQMTTYDLVLVVPLANSVQNAMVGPDTTLVGGLVAAATLLSVNRLLTFLLVRYPGLEQRLVGEPVLIVRNGRLLLDQMRKSGMTPELVMAAMREHGIGRLDDVRMSVLEVDGTVSVVPKEAIVRRTRRHFRALRIQ